MKAVTFQGIKNVEVKDVEDPKIEKQDDIIVRITSSAICGSDLHLIHGMVPNFPQNFIIGHEPVGVVEEVGKEVTKLKKGDRVIIPFNVACGHCWYCENEMTSQCDNSNPHGDMGAYFGYTETMGGYQGGQAEYMRVPYGNFTPFKVPEDSEVDDVRLSVIADSMSTAYWTTENAPVKKGDTVIVLGCGPVGMFTQKFCWLKGAKRVIAVDYVDYRLQRAKTRNNVEIVNFEQEKNIGTHLKEMTKGGADIVIDASGMDAKMTPLEFLATGLKLQGGSLDPFVIATQCVRKGGTIHITGAYGGRYNAFPLGDVWQRNVNIRMGQAPVIPFMPLMYKMVAEDKIDPMDIITHVIPLSDAKKGYELFDDKLDDCVKVVLKPH